MQITQKWVKCTDFFSCLSCGESPCRRGSSAGDPRREAGKAARRIRMLWKIQRRKDGSGRRSGSSGRLRPSQSAGRVPLPLCSTVRKMKAAEGVSGRRGSMPGSWKASDRIRKARPLRRYISCRRSTLPKRRPAAAGADQAAQAVSERRESPSAIIAQSGR